MKIFTIGHSTRNFEDFLNILKKFKIEILIDVRRFPSSKKFPWFNKEFLEKELKNFGIKYFHYSELGGFRKGGYAKFAETKEFKENVGKLIELINKKVAAIMCSERFWWRCHRRYIANELVKSKIKVFHIFDEEKIQEHNLKDKNVIEKLKTKIYCDKKV